MELTCSRRIEQVRTPKVFARRHEIRSENGNVQSFRKTKRDRIDDLKSLDLDVNARSGVILGFFTDRSKC